MRSGLARMPSLIQSYSPSYKVEIKLPDNGIIMHNGMRGWGTARGTGIGGKGVRFESNSPTGPFHSLRLQGAATPKFIIPWQYGVFFSQL
jgi:hypothetical protein